MCQEVSGPDVKAEGKLVSLFPISALENSGEGQRISTSALCFASLPPNQTTGAVSPEVNVKVYLNPCAGVHSSPNYKDL